MTNARYLGHHDELNDSFTVNEVYKVFSRSWELIGLTDDTHCSHIMTKELYDKYFEEVKVLDKKELRNQEIKKACDELAELLIKKNNDYGDSFSRQYTKYGLVSALIRMDDKMRRLENLNKVGNAEVSESIADSLLDNAGYSLLAYVEETKQSK